MALKNTITYSRKYCNILPGCKHFPWSWEKVWLIMLALHLGHCAT